MVFPQVAASDYVIFGVNSVRPVDEVQDVVYLPAAESAADTSVKVCFMSLANMPAGQGLIFVKNLQARTPFSFPTGLIPQTLRPFNVFICSTAGLVCMVC